MISVVWGLPAIVRSRWRGDKMPRAAARTKKLKALHALAHSVREELNPDDTLPAGLEQ